MGFSLRFSNFSFLGLITLLAPDSPTSPFSPHTLLLQIVKYTFNMVALDLDDAFFDRTA
jgi:hypothetical protein